MKSSEMHAKTAGLVSGLLPAQVLHRLAGTVGRYRAILRPMLLTLAIGVFAAGIFWSVSSLSGVGGRIALVPLCILLGVGVPVSVLLNTLEYRMMTRFSGANMSWRSVLEITILSSAANMLPLPGGALARFGGMKANGAAFRSGSVAVILFAGLWAGAALVVSGLALALHWFDLGALFVFCGVCVLSGVVFGMHRGGANWWEIAIAAAIRFGLLGVEAARMYVAFLAIGAVVTLSDSAVFAISSFAGSAVSVVPAGLGVREVVAAALAPVIGLNPAAGFLASAINRVVGLGGLLVLTAGVLVLPKGLSR